MAPSLARPAARCVVGDGKIVKLSSPGVRIPNKQPLSKTDNNIKNGHLLSVFEAIVAVIEMVTEDKFKRSKSSRPTSTRTLVPRWPTTSCSSCSRTMWTMEAATGHRESMPMSSVEQRRKCEEQGQDMNSLWC